MPISERTKDKSRSSNEKHFAASRPSVSGLSLSKKISLSVSLLIAVVTFVTGWVVSDRMESHLIKQIKSGGKDTVSTLAGFGSHMARRAYQTMAQNNKNYNRRQLFYQEFETEFKKGFDKTQLDLLQQTIGSLGHQFLDAEFSCRIPDGKGHTLLFSLTDSDSEKEVKFTEIFTGDDFIIGIGERKSGGEKVDIYKFTQEIPAPYPDVLPPRNRPEKLQATIYLSAQKIEEAKKNVYITTVVIVLIALGVGLGAAILLSTSITKPLNLLVKDMQIVADGDLSHKTIAHSTDEVGYLSATFNELTHSLKVAHDAEIEQAKIKHELRVGHEIQQILLPKNFPKIPGYDLDAFYHAANELGGDYYDFIVVDKTHLGIVAADVAGKGISGSMYMTIMRTILNIAAVRNLSTRDCLVQTNKLLADRIKRGMFVTAFYVILDPRKHTIKFSSAGHNPMVVWRAKTRQLEKYNPTGIALGFDKGPLFQSTLKEEEIVLEKGDRFVIYTDGVVECMSEEREEYGDDTFFQFVVDHAELDSKTFVKTLVHDLKKHQGRAPQHDDITIVTFRRT